MADMTSNERSVHKELNSSQMKSSELGVTNVKDALKGFTNPFTIENKDKLFCLSLGLLTSSEVSSSLLKVEELGKSTMVEFIDEKLHRSDH